MAGALSTLRVGETGIVASISPGTATLVSGETTIAEAPQAYVARLAGVFRRHECDGLADKLVKLTRQNPKDVVVEISDVEYMNSYALGMLVKLSQDVGERGKKVVLAGAQGLILKLFQTVGLDQKLGNFPSEQEALEALKSGS